MIIGETIVSETYEEASTIITNPTVVWTPWFGRQGNSATFTLEVIAMSPFHSNLQVKLYTKNSEDADPGTVVMRDATNDFEISIASPAGVPAVASDRGINFKEWIRARITLTDEQDPAVVRTIFSHFRLLNPAWESN